MDTLPHLKYSSALLFLLMTLLNQSCVKPVNDSIPPPAQLKELRIQFEGGSISLNRIDSAELTLSQAGAPPIKRKFNRSMTGNTLYLTTLDLPAGTYTAEWLLFVKKPEGGNQYGRQHVYTNMVTLPLTAPIMVPAPSGDWSGGWLPRLQVHDADKHFTCVIAMDFSDPYYAIYTKGNRKMRYLYIDRTAKLKSGTSYTLVGAEANEKFNHFAPEGVQDRLQFQSLVEDMQGKAWNHGEILVEILDTNNEETSFYFEYARQ